MWTVPIGAGLGASRATAGEPCPYQRKSSRRIVALALFVAGSLAATISDAKADCTPAAGNNVTATCIGITINQGANAPPSTAATDGYGSGSETGLTVNVSGGASGTGTNNGINASDGTVTTATGATITGQTGEGINFNNFGKVTNSAGASITGTYGIAAQAPGGTINLTN